MKRAVVGILAHVDAGKTTLAEAMLYKTGKLRSPGRVDNGNTVMDSHHIERERGITVFMSQAEIQTEKMSLTLLDTPGHVDFSAETERVLNVLDYAILVISAADGVQSHTSTVWKLLKHYNIPVFVFVTKTDYGRRDNKDILEELQTELSPECIDFTNTDSDEFSERAALCSDELLEKFLSGSKADDNDISFLIKTRRIFPVYFGSGLKFDGVGEFIEGLERFIDSANYPQEFGARVFKITFDKDVRLTHIKLTGGSLKIKDTVVTGSSEEKINGIRIYNGSRYTSVNEVEAGEVCALAGLENTYNGQGLGFEHKSIRPVLEPIMNFRIILPDEIDPAQFLPKIRLLEEEDPLLKIRWDSRNEEIQACLMGSIQADILKSVVYERFGVTIEIGDGNIQYRETVESSAEGVGHYEPLRHYAEVHLVLEPLSRGSGIKLATVCSEDLLDRNWQRLILTHLAEKKHVGVLTGSELTDVKITLVSGRAHLKHTEGGDFRQATYRAVRQGLMNAKSVLLEPYYSFRLEIPFDNLGRAINDIHQKHGKFDAPEEKNGYAIIKGVAPVTEMNGYVTEVASYTSGKGRLSLEYNGYDVCHNSEKVIEEKAYNPEADIENTPDSVFCSHGAGFVVKWQNVPEYMHLGYSLKKGSVEQPVIIKRNFHIDDKELEAIMKHEFGEIKYELHRDLAEKKPGSVKDDVLTERKKWIIVDGYNVIFAWDELKEIADSDLSSARDALMHILSNFAAFTKNNIVLVFDAYKVPGNQGERFDYNNIHVVYTKERELADVYIEKLVSQIGKNDHVTIVTSDSLIQLSAVRFGVLRKSADEFGAEIDLTNRKISDLIDEMHSHNPKSTISDSVDNNQ